MISSLQNMKPWDAKKEEKLRKAKIHLEFVCRLYQMQISEGRWFLHEHPAGASSWMERCVLEVMRAKGVGTIVGVSVNLGCRHRARAEMDEHPQEKGPGL